MAENSPLKIYKFNATAVIQFIRPEIKNPLSIRTIKILRKSFSELNTNNVIDQIVFTGSENTFAAGADLREVMGLNETSARKFGRRGQDLMQLIYRSRKETVAAVDGFCMGGALDLAISCKLRIASPRSYFAHPGAKLGIITGWSGTQILPRLIGKKNAIELLATAKKIDAEEALRIGLVDEISENPLAKILRTPTQ